MFITKLCKSAWSGMSGLSGLTTAIAPQPIDPLDWSQFADLASRYDFSFGEFLETKTAADFVRANSESLTRTDNASWSTLGFLTVAMWVKPDDATTSAFMSKYDNGTGQREFLMRSVSGGPRFYISNDGTAANFAAAGAMNTSKWNFLAGRHDGSLGSAQTKIYHGTNTGAALSTDTATASGNRFNSTSPLQFSGYDGIEYMDGRIDTACAFTVALTDNQINWLYNTGAGRTYEDLNTIVHADNPGIANLISFWTFNEESGTREDLVNNNNLTDNNTVGANSGHIAYEAAAGLAIATAIDQEGTSDVIQATHTKKPILTEQGLYHSATFDGSDDFLQLAFPGGSSTIIDDEDAGWATVGSWTQSTTNGHAGDHYFNAAGVGNDTATWTFTVTPGIFQVWATWSTAANRATNAPYTIKDDTTALATVLVNQEVAPSGLTESGSVWKLLGTFNITSTTLAVTLTDNANEFVIADAILIKPVAGAIPQPTTVFVVGQFVGTGVTQVAFDGTDSISRQAFGLTTADKVFIQANTQVVDVEVDAKALTIYTIQYNGASSKVWGNGLSLFTGNPGATPLTGITLGSQYDGTAGFLDGEIYEVVVADAVMSNDDMNIIGEFFGEKYSITWNEIS